MLKVSTLIALFICIVYSNNVHNIELNKLPPNELEVSEQHEQDKKTLQTVKGYYTEEKKSSKLCKHNNNRRLNDYNPGGYNSLPIIATIDHEKTASSGDRVVTESIHGTNYNYKTENTDKGVNSDVHAKNCGCDDCVVEAKVLQFESLALATPTYNNMLNDAAIDFKNSESQSANNNSNLESIVESHVGSSESESVDFNSNPIDNSVRTSEPVSNSKTDNQIETDGLGFISNNNDKLYISSVPSLVIDRNNGLDSVVLNTNNGERTRLCNKDLDINTRRKKCGKFDLPQNLSKTTTTRRILPGIINKPTKQELEDNKLYQDSSQSNNNHEIETRQNYYPNVHKISNNYDIDLVHNMNINDAPEIEDASIESQLIEPTKGKGIYDMKDAGVMLLENSRVCYACSTMSDPTCWSPDRRTTVKYCRKGHQSCLTKSFKHKGKSVIIRDCGSHCVSGEESYSSCSICHSDLCNGASSISIFSTSLVAIVLCGILFNKH